MIRALAIALTLALGADASCLGADADCPTLDKVAWTLPVTTQEIIATTAVKIEWTSGFHDVWKMSSKAALDACSFEAAELVGGPARSPPRCKDDVCSAMVALPEAGSTDYYACKVGSHCEAGMKLSITGAPPIDPVPGDKDVVGGDRDEYGCCGSCGYSWCSSANGGAGECVRPWETPCEPYVTDGGCECEETWTSAACPDEQLGCPAEACDGWAGGRWCRVDKDACPTAILDGDLAYDTCGNAEGGEAPGEPGTGGPDPLPEPTKTLEQLIKENADLSKFEKLLEAHDLDEKLGGAGPWTVLAPTDEAVDDNNPAEVLLLALDGNGIAKYHIVKGAAVASTDLADGQVVETWEGDTLDVEVKDGEVAFVDGFGNRARVVAADQVATNGVLHVIDDMLFWTADGDDSDAGYAPRLALAALAAALVAALY